MKKFLSMLVLIISSLILGTTVLFSSACVNQKNKNYQNFSESELLNNAELFDKAEEHLTDKFLKKNKTHFPFETDNLPNYVCQVIDTNSKFKNVFKSFPQEVDFTQDILVVYLFTDIYYGYECELQTITKNERNITFEVLHKMAEKDINSTTPPSTSYPTQRCLVIRIPDCNFEAVNVNLNYT